MVVKPRVLLLDEPTSGVSADEKFAIMDMVMDAVRAEGVTVLFVEHDMDIVSRYAQRVIAFYDGRIIADAPPAVALADPEVRHVMGNACLRWSTSTSRSRAVHILRGVASRCRRGSMIGLIGRNGAGKAAVSRDLSIDEASYRKHLRDVAAVRGLSAITINAHASEVASCTFEEQQRVLEITMDEVGDDADRARRLRRRQPRGGAHRAHGGAAALRRCWCFRPTFRLGRAARDGHRAFQAHRGCDRACRSSASSIRSRAAWAIRWIR